MEIYLVRHGETDGNLGHRHQLTKTPLSPVGKRQVESIAQVLKEYKPTHLVSSRLVRAVQTASVIGDVCGLVPELSEHFIELERPNFLYGQRHKSIKSLWFYLRWYLGTKKAEAEGGESYKELRQRINLAKVYLEQFPDDARVVIVSHSVFMSFFSAHVCDNEGVSVAGAVAVFKDILNMPNTHIMPVLFESTDHSGICTWSVEK
jgi:broad specificity phosphatase PhoE